MAGGKRIAFVGEAWGIDEEEASLKAGEPRPFVGAAGRLFNSLLNMIGITRAVDRVARTGVLTITEPENILVTNVFNRRPPRNEVKRIFVPRKGSDPDWPALDRGKYLDPDLRGELDRLYAELTAFKPDVVVALGATPLWALCKVTGIMSRRGCLHAVKLGRKTVPVIPTIHPAFILRKYTWYVLAASDFRKAAAVAEGKLKPENPAFITDPTLAQVRAAVKWPGPIIFDIETIPKFRTITCVGIGNLTKAICIPFVDMRKPGRNYWPTSEEESEAWRCLATVLENPKTEKITQVGTYDVTWLREVAGIEVAGKFWDTRLLHHALWPELPHDLGAICTSFPDILMPPWKAAHKAGKADN